VADVPEVMSLDDSPEEYAINSEAGRQMKQLLGILPEKQREILILRLVMGLSAEETAAAVGSTAGAIRVAQHRAIARLKKEVTRAGERNG
jgi:RNA polymerase sigma-70 factor (ECF subfamily)